MLTAIKYFHEHQLYFIGLSGLVHPLSPCECLRLNNNILVNTEMLGIFKRPGSILFGNLKLFPLNCLHLRELTDLTEESSGAALQVCEVSPGPRGARLLGRGTAQGKETWFVPSLLGCACACAALRGFVKTCKRSI